MKAILSSALLALSMYTVLPVPRTQWRMENMRWLLCFFPLAGVFVGGVLFFWRWLAQAAGLGVVLTAAGAVVLPVLLTGGIHLDGYCDALDAIASHTPAQRRLEIMKDPHTGAFAVIGCCVYFLTAFGLWSQLVWDVRTAGVLSVGFVLSRALSGFSVVAFRNARADGTAAMFACAADKRRTAGMLLIVAIFCSFFMLWLAPVMAAACLFTAGLVLLYYRQTAIRDFGGITGDLAGWFLQLCEIAMLGGAVLTQEVLKWCL